MRTERPGPNWVAEVASPEIVLQAVNQGSQALENRTKLERSRIPLPIDTPAGRAQRAAATSRVVKPMADAAYAVEEATRALVNG